LISELPASIAASLPTAELGCPVLLDGGKPFDLPLDVDPQIGKSLRGLLAGEIASK
jgi:hypothetical protein